MTKPAPLRRDAAANRTRLISAAVDVFNDEGLDAGVEHIAQRAGVGVGTLYRRFPTKDALIQFLLAQMIDDLTQAAIEGQSAPGGRGLEQFLRAATDQLIANRGCLQRLWKHGTVDEAAIAVLRGHIDSLVTSARDAGTIRSDVTREDVTTVMWALQGVIDNAGDRAQVLGSRMITLALAGLTAPA